MKPWQRPTLTVFGNVTELTKNKACAGTDAFSGSQPEPGGDGPNYGHDSQDAAVTPYPIG